MSNLFVNTITDASGGTTATVNYWDLFDYRDGALYWKQDQGSVPAGSLVGSVNSDGYVLVSIKKKRILAHRIIYAMFNGSAPAFVDHINGNKHDNRIENLREATLFTNGWNRPQNKNNKTQTKNVCWVSREQKWLVQLMAHGKRVVCMRFEDFDLAELVAAEARDKYHGQFAYKGA
jgi:hypothetical protein